MGEGYEYAERMFPAPVALGIAELDRAVSSVPFGTSSSLEPGGRGEGTSWYEGGGVTGERAVQGITVYPPTRGVATQGDPFEPVKIGVLVDMDLGQLLADWIDPTILAIEDALNEGAHPLDAGYQRRTGHLHSVRPARPQGLQGRLPHHPRAAGRPAPLRRLPPTRVALQPRMKADRA